MINNGLINIITHLHFQWPKRCHPASSSGLCVGGSCAEEQNHFFNMNKFNKDKYERAISHLTLMLLVSRMSLSMLLASPESFQGSCWKMTPSPAQLYKL